MEALPEDEFPDMDEIHSKTLSTKPCQARPKKKVLKQWTVFDVESPHQKIINSKLLNWSMPLCSSQTMKETVFQEPRKPTPVTFSISGQTPKSLKEIKENIEDERIVSKQACGNQRDARLKSCRRSIDGLDSYRHTGRESGTNNKKGKFENVMDQPSQKTSNILEANESSHCLINDYTKDIENHFSQDQSCFPDLNNLSPNMCFIASKTPPTNHNRSFSLANTSFIDLKTPPTLADKSICVKDLERPVTNDSNILKTPMNFSTVTVSELGISPEAFTFKSSEKIKSSLSKYRRRSTIGLRGSPETNYLIRYIAQQKLEHPEDPSDMVSPFRPGRHSSLKEKISAFRDSFLSLEEREQSSAFTEFLDDGLQHAENASIKSPFLKRLTVPDLHKDPPSKQNDASITDQSNTCAVNKSVVNDQLLKSIPRQVSEGVSCSRTTPKDLFAASPLWVPNNVKHSTAILTAKTEGQANASPAFWKRTFSMGTKSTFTKLSTPEKCDRLYPPSLPLQHGVSPAGVQTSSSPFLRPVLKKTPTPAKHGKEPSKAHVLFSVAEGRSSSSDSLDSSVAKSPKLGKSRTVIQDGSRTPGEPKDQKRKKVTFGRALSPEIFDKTLPANTPLRKGTTPDHCKSLSNIKFPVEALPLIHLEPIEQPNFDNDEESEESSSRSFPVSSGAGNVQASGAVADPDSTSSQVSEAVNCEVISTPDVPEPLLESEHLKQIDESPSEESQNNAVADCNSEETTHKESTVLEGGRITRSTMKRKCAEIVENPCLSNSVTPDATNKEDNLVVRKNPPQSAKKKPPVKKRTTKVRYGRKKGRGKKVQKVIYGERETVSRKPLLSPIFEVPEVLSNTSSTSPAWGFALAQDSSESSDGSRHPPTNRMVKRRKRSARGTGRRRRDSSEDSTCDEAERDQVSDGEATTETDESSSMQGFGSPETSLMPPKHQTVEENNISTMVPWQCLEDAPGRSSEEVGASSVSVTLPEVQENETSVVVNMRAERASAVDEPSSTATDARHAVQELPGNMSIDSAIPCVLNITKSQRRQSRRLSLQIPTTSLLEEESILPVSKMKKSRRASCETSKKLDDAFVQVPAVEKNSAVPTILTFAPVVGSGLGSSQDDMFRIKTADRTEGKTKKSSKNGRRITVFCPHPDNAFESVPAAVDVLTDPPLEDNSVPSCVDDPEVVVSDTSFNIEETFQNVATSERTVRRSMRLRRSSGVVGLSWINDIGSETDTRTVQNTNRKLRRSKVNTPALKENNSPTPKLTIAFSSPGKENCEHPSLLYLPGKPSRRRTLCTSSIQKHSNIEARKIRKGRRSFKVDAMDLPGAEQGVSIDYVGVGKEPLSLLAQPGILVFGKNHGEQQSVAVSD
ncbi:cell division cycle-associated protein 2 isoform X2 [Lissotriton helveticus]